MRPGRLVSLVLSLSLRAAGLAAPAPAAANHTSGASLPDLGMAPLTDFSVHKRPKGQRWLRFNATIVNVGAGPFQAYGYERNSAGELKVDQQLWAAPVWEQHATPAVMYWSGDGHNHWRPRVRLMRLPADRRGPIADVTMAPRSR